MSPELTILLAILFFAPVVYVLFNYMADIWERVMKKPFWIRRYIPWFIAIGVAFSIIQFIITSL